MVNVAFALQKPFAVVVNVAGRLMKKEFDKRTEADSFSAVVKEKYPQAVVDIVEKRERPRGKAGQAYSIGFVPVISQTTGEQMIDAFGDKIYKAVPVPRKRGLLFCAHCHEYRRFIRITGKYGQTYTGCEDCGISDNDFYVKTCNQLWRRE